VRVRVLSWNVNGIRAVVRHGFWDWLATEQLYTLCLQETRIQHTQLTPTMQNPPGYHAFWHAAERKGYSGVATLCQEKPLAVRQGLGLRHFDAEGRVLVTQHSGFTLVNAYFPSGRRGHERVAFKIDFYDALLTFCSELAREGHSLVVCGDFNTAHQPVDLARPKQNRTTSGFLPEERNALGRWLDSGFVDVFRHLHPDAREYTWWTYRFNARSRNIGWRIDLFLVAEELVPQVQDARILGDVPGSDHCPIELLLDV
jgi:exodeoxyribonuclease-3